MKKMILTAMLLSVALLLLVSCSSGTETQGTQPADTPNTADTTQNADNGEKGRLIIDPNGTEYVMIVPKDAKSLHSVCTDAKSKIYGIAGKNLFVKYDTAEKAGRYEILVGMTNREESERECAKLQPNEYHIMWDGDKLLVAAGSNYSAKIGMQWLLDTYIKGTQGDTLYLPSDLNKKGTTNLNISLTGLKSGWNLLTYPAENGVELPFQIYMPANYDENKQYPLILQMHSAGVKNDDGSQIYAGEAKFLRNLEKSKYKDEVIVISPSCPVGEKWVPAKTWKEITYDFVNTKPEPYMVAVTELFAHARKQLSVDESRLYVYGMSMGGFATWDLLARNPDTFAAAIPVAGAGDPSVVSKLSGTAIWIFHGSEDATVPCESSQTMYDAFLAIGRTDVKFTKFEGAGHGIWAMTADTDGLLDWLFSQKR